jgi:hypothetical protein
MQGMMFQVAFHVTGTLGANFAAKWKAYCDCKLVHVSAVGSNANNGILDIGPSTDTDGYLDGVDIGDSAVPTEFKMADFVDGQFPHILAGTIICVNLDYDGAGGTATQDFTVVLTFGEG